MILQADLHTHTIASTHAYSTILENCTAADRYDLKAIAMTDHTELMPDSPHIWHFENLRCLPRKICGVTVLRGAETNVIDINGNLDIPSALQKKLEWIVVSMHKDVYKPSDFETHTQTYLNIAKNPYVDVIGHCTTNTFPFDFERGVKAFKEYEKLVEINESSIMAKVGSKENANELLKLCKKFEVPVVVDTDAHFCELIGQAPLALQMIDELDFPKRLVANADWETLRERMLKKRPHLDI